MTLAIACIAVAAVLPIVCAGIAKWGFEGYDNHDPRRWLARQTGFRARANAAQANSWEAFPVFAAGVLAAQLGGAPQARVDLLAIAFVVARVAYVALYIADLAPLRSAVWTAGFALSLALYFASAW
jgi:uncharacterized MAPEG superfamily protein